MAFADGEEATMARTESNRKELILQMVQKLPDDVTYDRVMYHLEVMRDIEIALGQLDRGEGIPHEEFVAELRAKGWLDDAPESSGRRARKKTSRKSAAISAAATTRARRARSSNG
jgi:hypothetical protein